VCSVAGPRGAEIRDRGNDAKDGVDERAKEDAEDEQQDTGQDGHDESAS
jgi:hypothetical protein